MARRSVVLFIVGAILASCTVPSVAVLPPATFEEADRELLQGDYLRAAQLYERLANQHSGEQRVTAIYQACVCRLKLGQAAAALPKLQKLASSVREPRMAALIHDALSEAHRMQGQHSEALRALLAIQEIPRQEVERTLKSDELMYKLGCAHYRAGDPARGAAVFNDLLVRHPQSLRATDAGLRLAVRGYGVRVGEPYPAAEETLPPPAAGGLACSYVKVQVKGRPAVQIAVVSGLPSYDEALRVAERLSREGVKAEALP